MPRRTAKVKREYAKWDGDLTQAQIVAGATMAALDTTRPRASLAVKGMHAREFQVSFLGSDPQRSPYLTSDTET